MRWRLLILLLAPTVWADSADAARQHYQQGTTYYDLGQYKDAAREYEEAYRAKNDPALLFNIGQAYRLGGDAAGALRSYRAFLRRQPDAKNRAEVEAHIVKLQQLVDEQQHQTTSPPAPRVAPETHAQLSAAPPERQPIYKKWWLWTAVGGVVVVGLAVGLAVAYTTPKDASGPPGTVALKF